MAVSLYDTLTQQKQPLRPKNENAVNMYCCGITPYSNTHIGHTRTFFSYDLLFRVLNDAGYTVRWARNITDVDDKIIAKAVSEGVSTRTIVDRFVSEQTEVLDKFNLNKPLEPRVTETIPAIIHLIARLVEKNAAYTTPSGVYFRVQQFPEYGKLSKNKVEELRKGARIEVDENKADPVDFALWKFAKDGEPEDVVWDSPWGRGRPGWHIECSAMVEECFGPSIDIHMGGRDLIFPHHECEIAQSEAASGQKFSNIWMHCGMVTLYGEKMSKSTNHFVSIASFLEKYPPEVLRLIFLSASYSQPLDYTDELAQENFKKLGKIYRTVALVSEHLNDPDRIHRPANQKPLLTALSRLVDEMRGHMHDDLNSAAALASFFEFARTLNQTFADLEKKGLRLHDDDAQILTIEWPRLVAWMAQTLGLLNLTPDAFFAECAQRKITGTLTPERIEALLAERARARQQKDWTAADRVRDELLAHGLQVQDTPAGPRWTIDL
jgi:cysteinyl-tRNA synthetase